MHDPLVTVDWLAEHLNDVRVIDGTWSMPADKSALPAGFIPSSTAFDLDLIADRSSGMAHMLPSATVFADAVGNMGITLDDTVVIYDRHGVFSAPRVWWTFRMFGHKNVYVLDGGLPAWIKAGHRTEPDVSSFSKSFYKVTPARAKVVNFDAVVGAIGTDIQIVDARPTGRFKGTAPEPREGLPSGHMPGALNVPFGALRTSEMTLKPLSEIGEYFKAVDLTAPIITTCGSGITAAALAFNLARLGASSVSVYDGSWADYGARDDAQIIKD